MDEFKENIEKVKMESSSSLPDALESWFDEHRDVLPLAPGDKDTWSWSDLPAKLTRLARQMLDDPTRRTIGSIKVLETGLHQIRPDTSTRTAHLIISTLAVSRMHTGDLHGALLDYNRSLRIRLDTGMLLCCTLIHIQSGGVGSRSAALADLTKAADVYALESASSDPPADLKSAEIEFAYLGQIMRSMCSTCGTIAPHRTLSKCGGCLEERYCSEACQAAHWAVGHREACRRTPHATRMRIHRATCSCCGKVNDDKRPNTKCSVCKDARYCNMVCQRTHWKGGHAFDCVDASSSLSSSKETESV